MSKAVWGKADTQGLSLLPPVVIISVLCHGRHSVYFMGLTSVPGYGSQAKHRRDPQAELMDLIPLLLMHPHQTISLQLCTQIFGHNKCSTEKVTGNGFNS